VYTLYDMDVYSFVKDLSSMFITIDYNSGVSVSRQIEEQVKYMAVSGKLKPGEMLPSVRSLAMELKVNPTTVARVYRRLESEGVIITQPGRGSFISSFSPGLTSTAQEERMRPEVRKIIVEAGRLGMDFDKLIKLVKEEINKISDKEK
jgi:GntR family transcriptional regulator